MITICPLSEFLQWFSTDYILFMMYTEKPTHLGASLNLPLGLSINMGGLLTINTFEFASIQFDINIRVPLSGNVEIEFGITTEFAIGTGTSSCENPDLESECLATTITATIALSPLKMAISFEMATEGAWIEPMYLRNFAIIDPVLALGIENQNVCVPVPCPLPSMVKFGVTLVYKKPSQPEWPPEMYDKTNWPVRPGVSPWLYKNENFITLELRIHYETVEHADEFLNNLMIPVVSSKL